MRPERKHNSSVIGAATRFLIAIGVSAIGLNSVLWYHASKRGPANKIATRRRGRVMAAKRPGRRNPKTFNISTV